MKIMSRNIALMFISGFLLTALFSYSSCTKIDVQAMLEITVVDEEGKPYEGILVGLFDSLDEWSMLANPVQAWKETNSSGKVVFMDLQEIRYYIFADGDSVSNIGKQVQLNEELRINEIRQIKVFVE